MESDEDSLKALRERTKQQLRSRIGARCEKIGAVEGKVDASKLQEWIRSEISRYGGRSPQVDDE